MNGSFPDARDAPWPDRARVDPAQPYASRMAMDGEELSRNVTRLMGANDAETARWEWHGLDPLETVATEPELKRRGIASDVDAARFQQVYFDAWPALYADAELRTALSVRSTAFNSRLFYLRRMAAVTDELHQAIMQQATPSGS